MSKTIEINGVLFELRQPRKNKVYFEDVNHMINNFTGRDLWDCYDRPSDVKQKIYRMWRNWELDSENNRPFIISNLEVDSYNCMQFTLCAIAWEQSDEGTIYVLKITRDHNYATIVTR